MARPALVLTPEERIAFPYLFAKADSDQIGVLVGDKAVAFFAHSKLPPTILGEIWQLADQDNAGFLTRHQFDIALRLIGKAQRGLPINEAAISTPGPLCRLKGYSIPGLPSPTSPIPVSGLASSSSAPDSSAYDSLYTIKKEDKTKYARMFMNAGPNDGLLDGEKARDIFVRSKLPFEKLGQIWTLSDTQSRGALSVGDFSIAMHLIQLCMSGQLSTLPPSLPPALLESAGGTPGSTRAIPRQMTGQPASILQQSSTPLRHSTMSNAIRPQYTGRSTSGLPPSMPPAFKNPASPVPLAWDISPAELAQSNVYFDSLDTGRLGFITGDCAVPFMMESKLPGDVLAQIWDLADIRGEGKLSREEFAIAMRLIQDTLAGGLDSLMAKLPTSMVPPSLRETAALPSIQASDTQRDLLSLMDDDEPASSGAALPKTQAVQPQLTGTPSQITSLPPQLTGSKAMSPESRVVSPLPPAQGALPPQLTGQSLTNGYARSVSGPTEDNGARLGNLQNQLLSTEQALSSLQRENSRLDAEVGNTSSQIKALELKLSNVRAAFQAESPIVEELRAKQAEQRSTVIKLTGEVITAESELSGLKVEKEQIEGTILRDKEEVRGIKKRIVELEEETQRLKATLEVLKKDSRLQKGLVAIGKKQVSTIEAQQDEVAHEVSTLEEQVKSLDLHGEGSRGGSPAPMGHSNPASLPPKSTNPFERMLASSPLPASKSSVSSGHSPQSHLNRSLHATNDDGAIAQTDDSGDPFSSGGDVPRSGISRQAPTLSFGDAFGFDESKGSDGDRSLGQHGLQDASSAPGVSAPSERSSSVLPDPKASSPRAEASSEEKRSESHGASEDESSDEDEIEDAVGTHPPQLRQAVDPTSFTSSKFPPVEDVETSIGSAAAPRRSPSQSTVSPAEETFFPARSEGFGAQPSGPSEGMRSPLESAKPNSKSKVAGSTGFASFGDELEVSDFAADFGTMGSSKASGATLEDFDSAFASLPPPSSKAAGQSTLAPGDAGGAGYGGAGGAFEDSFGDSFVPPSKEKASDEGFGDAFGDFDSAFEATGDSKKKPSEVDPFGSPTVGEQAPALPSRPTVGDSGEQARPTDSQAVQQICSMGFKRSVAIQALERDEWDLERALNHLLGS